MEVTMRTEFRILYGLAFGVIVAVLAAACGDGRHSVSGPSPVGATRGGVAGVTTSTPQSDNDVAGSNAPGETLSEARANTTAVCHLEGNGTYHLIEINAHALDAHLKHGDVLPEHGDVCPEPITATAGR
jgi:hypothetical protein